ncbi:type II toxin-antitoxin system RelE/ParE family toxin [Citrobacter freundii]|uniref:Type II toxin-antitoxin system RelE/ParE family toxin n=1 Tax=Citrobacter freundii TaxID=546 RepID=A0AAI9MPB0_CITFR|nr:MULTISPECIES: type II toxin-antitoxin system RelE/ParE family toxin [Citrobacter]EGT0655907.1 addiction module toxin RelE [Citrobacter freundii]EJG2190133.1 type II toxin-antitoxin system RelE/ParE family toxin [Citrobacter freundii]EKV7202789.1 type II toxin-antitoxin system RelE/ParE family toxin [Citrobacter freundii]EKW4406316.1 type II toxin-antitoxin system RelE/ParE family toxin [Citrobacter freundii]EKX8779277.1 type II toxin-antitoxin system RelE/ParE family toxin [Citrobacter freu
MTKPLYWVGQARKDLLAMPEHVRDTFGFAFWLAQQGKQHSQTKPLKGFGGAGVLEVVEDYHGSAWRAVYTIQLKNAVYVLHVFQKKSVSGKATPKPEIDLIYQRLKAAQRHAQESGYVI